MNVSAYSLKALADAVAAADDRAAARSSVSTSTPRSAWPAYDWMGVAKAALESTARYLARDLGPQRHPRQPGGRRSDQDHRGASRSPASRQFEDVWADRAPLGWDVKRPQRRGPACVALLSDWFPMTTGEIIHVDGGYHAMGA